MRHGHRGERLSKAEILRIVTLLKNTELSLKQIAIRMQCTPNAVGHVNRDFGVRVYDGKRCEWRLAS